MAETQMKDLNPRIIRCLHTAPGNIPTERGAYPRRTVALYELEYVASGAGYIMADGQRLEAIDGTVFLRVPGMDVQGYPPYRGFCILWELMGAASDAQAMAGCIGSLPRAAVVRDRDIAAAQFQSAYEAYLTDDPYKGWIMKAAVLRILHMLARSLPAPSCEYGALERHRGSLDALTDYIGAHLDEKLTTARLANLCHFSEGFLCRLFKRAKGMTLFTYINNERIRQSRMLLIETDLPIKDICVRCGFENESYFYRVFKNRMGVSPAAYRGLHRLP